MRMTFGAEDEDAFVARREELCSLFAEWSVGRNLDVEAGDVELLLDWKWGYADGGLDRWDAADVEEFLLRWCPGKVVGPPDVLESIPGSVAAYAEFLAHEGLLAPGCSAPVVGRACAELGPRFQRAMAATTPLPGRPDDARPTASWAVRAPADAEAADPITADADALVRSLLALDEDAAAADLAAWAATHPAGAPELTAAATRADLSAGDVLTLLEVAGSVVGAEVDRAAEAHRDGPHGPLVSMWLLLRGSIEASSVAPGQMLLGTVEVAAAMIDSAGPDGVVAFIGSDVDQALDVLEHLWRADHERTREVLDTLGRHHPDGTIATAARRSLDKARNRG